MFGAIFFQKVWCTTCVRVGIVQQSRYVSKERALAYNRLWFRAAVGSIVDRRSRHISRCHHSKNVQIYLLMCFCNSVTARNVGSLLPSLRTRGIVQAYIEGRRIGRAPVKRKSSRRDTFSSSHVRKAPIQNADSREAARYVTSDETWVALQQRRDLRAELVLFDLIALVISPSTVTPQIGP